jgi:N,N'-diacetyllegionaminate synthase
MASTLEEIGIRPGKVFVIAEAGVNHNGNFELAKRLVDGARKAGADAVKFQAFNPERLVTVDAEKAEYQKTGNDESQLDMLKRLELGPDKFKSLKEYCDKKGIMFLSTPHTEDMLEVLDCLVPAHKIASGDLTNLPFLKKIKEKGKPVILSTGMGTISEIKEAIDALKGVEIVLLHCTTSYPCEREDVNLRAMDTLKKEFGLPTGYSDHTVGIDVALMAVKRGAAVIEKHFTLDRTMDGPDHKAAIEPTELKEMIMRIRAGSLVDPDGIVLGSAEKGPTIQESIISKSVRKSLVASRDIPSGTIISDEMLTVKRPGTGISPAKIDVVIGKKAKVKISEDEPLGWEKLE